MTRLTRSLYSSRLLDITFALMGGGAIVVLAVDTPSTDPAGAASVSPLLGGGILAAMIVAVALLMCKASALDRRCADDYTYQTLALSAVIGLLTMVVGHALWAADFLLGRWLPDPGAGDMVLLALAGWAIGYLYYRLRGTVA